MNDKTIFADVNLPFHVWVRERSATREFRWVLREAAGGGRDAGAASAGATQVAHPPGFVSGD